MGRFWRLSGSTWFAGLGVLTLGLIGSAGSATAEGLRPNIIYILADDLGYGDVSALNPEGKIRTPRLDRLAAEGMTFTDAHSGSAVCTPTRYGILTGRYCWRSRLKSGVLGGFSTHLIDSGRLTVADLLKSQGYRTACIGKWHLGMDWPRQGGGTADDRGEYARGYEDAWQVDYTAPIRNGPTTRGFDEFFGISASLDMPPFAFIRNDRTLGVPTVEKTWIRTGPATEDFEAVDVLPRITEEAVAFIDRCARADDGRPFFLYIPLNAPHTPIVPTEEFRGRSGVNPYADFVMQTDAAVGRILDALDRHGLADGTLVVFTSDNGCSPQADFPTLAEHGHSPSYHFRGYKADIFEGGHRIPLLVRWPGVVAPGTTGDHLTCLTDLMATCAEILGVDLPAGAGEDSVSMVPALRGEATGLREAIVHHSINGSFAIRQGSWKLCLCPDSGGWSAPRPGRQTTAKLPPVQLYDLSADIAERQNVQADHPEVVARLTALLEGYIARGRSTPGTPQENDAPIEIRPPAAR